MTIDASTSGKHTVVINDREITFDQRVVEILTLGNRVLVMLNGVDFPPDDPNKGRNIFAYDENGELLWRIEDSGFTAGGPGGKTVKQGYTGMGPDEDGRFRVFQPIGCFYDVDLETGKISNPELTR